MAHYPAYNDAKKPYFVLPEGVSIIIIKLYDLFYITFHLDSILVMDVVTLSLGSKDLGHPNKLIGILDEAPYLLPFGNIEDPIIS